MVASHVRFTTSGGVVIVAPIALLSLASLSSGGLYKAVVVGTDIEHSISPHTYEKLSEIIDPFECCPPKEEVHTG